MHLIRPFAALRPSPEHAADVLAPPYDVLSTEEARARAAGRPWSFLHISKPEIDLPQGTDPYSPQVYAKAAESLRGLVERGILRRDREPCYYVYRLGMSEHVQTGLVATASVADYEHNRIRRHELTRPDKEDDRVRQIEAVNAQTGPALLVYPAAPDVDAILAGAASGDPVASVRADDAILHTIWVIDDKATIETLTRAFDVLPALYIADGHHRSAAASRVAARRRSAAPQGARDQGWESFLCVIFPHHQMQILDYNRVVADLNGMTEETFLARLGEHFQVQPSSTPPRPSRPGEFGLYLPGRWFKLALPGTSISEDDPVARLDVSLLSSHVLEPLLAITDARRDKRIDFVGGIRGLVELERRVDEDGMAAAFALYPTRMEHLMAVADAGLMMPPKSTWFEPKLADGLVSHMLD